MNFIYCFVRPSSVILYVILKRTLRKWRNFARAKCAYMRTHIYYNSERRATSVFGEFCLSTNLLCFDMRVETSRELFHYNSCTKNRWLPLETFIRDTVKLRRCGTTPRTLLNATYNDILKRQGFLADGLTPSDWIFHVLIVLKMSHAAVCRASRGSKGVIMFFVSEVYS